MGDVVLENTSNPFTQDRLTPEHLALLFPPKFYQNDDSLALHLSESCLVESTTWDGNIAIGDMAFWLKVLSTPQTEYLKQQKRAFKSRVAEMCRDIRVKDGRPVAKKLHTELQDSPPKPVVQQLKMTASNILMKPKPTLTTVLVVDSSAGEDQSKPKASNQITQLTLDAVASPTPGFGLNSYKCTTCDFATDTRERLNHHQKMAHAGERPYSCEYCDYTSKYSWNIKTHVDNVHLKTKRFKCAHCDFTSPQACLLRRHVSRVHTNARDVKCQYCDYRTNHKDVLRRHVHMKHTGDFDHKCPYCAFGRDAKYEVEDHINAVHLKKVIYQCSECSFQTYRKITLKSHHKDHASKPMLSCPSCNMKSIYPSTLAKHIRDNHPQIPMPEELKGVRHKIEQKNIASGDVDYTPVLMCRCKLCDFTCEKIVTLKAHVRKAHNANSRHSCPICKTGFANKRNLTNHMAKQHNISKSSLSNNQFTSSKTGIGDETINLVNSVPLPTLNFADAVQTEGTLTDVDGEVCGTRSLMTTTNIAASEGESSVTGPNPQVVLNFHPKQSNSLNSQSNDTIIFVEETETLLDSVSH